MPTRSMPARPPLAAPGPNNEPPAGPEGRAGVSKPRSSLEVGREPCQLSLSRVQILHHRIELGGRLDRQLGGFQIASVQDDRLLHLVDIDAAVRAVLQMLPDRLDDLLSLIFVNEVGDLLKN